MKKSLLFYIAFAYAMVISAAEWTKPVYSGQFQPLTVGETVYVFNTESKLFLTEGNDWGTHASVGAEGLRFMVSQSTDTDWDGKTYFINVESVAKSGWYKMFITDGGNVYVDNTTQEDNMWEFNDLGENKYQIKGAAANPVWKSSGDLKDFLLGYYTEYMNTRDNIKSGTGVIYDEASIDVYDEGTFLTTWAFVSQSDYEAYYLQVVTYEAALALGAKISDAEAMGVTGLDNEKAVYANTSSTKEELDAAAESVERKVLAYYETVVTPDNPVNILTDDCRSVDGWGNAAGAATFNTNDWVGDDWEGFSSPYLNIWDGSLNGKIYKERTGLPNGIYVVTISALSQSVVGAVYANENQKTVPADNCGHQYKITTEVTDGNLQFGYIQETAGTNWVTLDEVSVDYFGQGTEAYRYWLNGLLESAPSFDDAVVMDDLVTEYNAVLASVNTAQTKEEILAIIPAYEEILNRINLNIAAYNKLIATSNAADELSLSEYVNDYYAGLINDFGILRVDPVLEEHKLGTDEVYAVVDELQALIDEAQNYAWDYEKLLGEVTTAAGIYAEYKDQCSEQHAKDYEEWMNKYNATDFSEFTGEQLKALLEELYTVEFNLQVPADPASDDNPVDYTSKIQYPSFDDGGTGWINDKWSTCGLNDWNSWVDGDVFDQLFLNLWDASSQRVYQTLTGLPEGAYVLQISAYADAAGLQVYANNDCMDVTVGQNENGAANTYSNIAEPEPIAGEIWRGNVYRIATVVGEEGTMEIGVRNISGGEMWAMIDKVTLTYYGDESAIVTSINVPESHNGYEISAIYTTSGARVNALQKGINIVKMNDGSVRKIWIK